MLSMDEVWKDVSGHYQVSNSGKVRSQQKILSTWLNNKGYRRVTIYSNRKRKHLKISRLVAEAFLPNPLNLPEVNHKDGNRQNDNVDNLEWTTHRDNVLHSFRSNKRKSPMQYAIMKAVAKEHNRVEYFSDGAGI